MLVKTSLDGVQTAWTLQTHYHVFTVVVVVFILVVVAIDRRILLCRPMHLNSKAAVF